MLRSVRRSIGLKLALAVAAPSVAIAAAGASWLGRGARGLTPACSSLVGAAVVFVVAMAATQLVAARLLVERPLRVLGDAVRRAREGDLVPRVELDRGDALGTLAFELDSTLAALGDLHARRLEDEASMTFLRSEVALKAELEARVRELSLLHDLGRALAATLDPAAVIAEVEALVRRSLPCDAFELRLQDAREAPSRPPRNGTLEIPMRHGGDRVGVLAVSRAAEPFAAEDVSLLESIASQAALALANARLHQETLRLSLTDPLTGIANRRALFARLELEVERCDRFEETLGVAIVDVDHFKRLNDAFGHSGGDAILRGIAATLQGGLRKVDLVGRFGGEEFAIVLPGADRAAALAVGEKLRAAIANARLEPRGTSAAPVTISVGVAVYPSDARDLRALIDCADAALYAAKRAGRNAVQAFAEGMREHPGRERDVSITAAEEPKGG